MFEILTDKIGESGQPLVRRAYQEARSRNDNELRPQHVLIAFAESEPKLFEALLNGLNLDRAVLQSLSEKPNQDAPQSEAMRISREFHSALAEGLKRARAQGRGKIESIDILFGLFADERGSTAKRFEQLGVDRDELLRQLEALSAGD